MFRYSFLIAKNSNILDRVIYDLDRSALKYALIQPYRIMRFAVETAVTKGLIIEYECGTS